MFFYNRGAYWTFDDAIKNIILSASSMTQDKMERRFKGGYFKDIPVENLLFDPQLYFSEIHIENCKECFSKLATYDLFNNEPIEHNSSEGSIHSFQKQAIQDGEYKNIDIPQDSTEISKRINNSLDFQKKLNVSKFILPTPIISPTQENYDLQLKWIEEGLKLVKDYDTSSLVTVAINESSLIYEDIDENSLVSIVLDSLTAMEDADGFYIVIEQNTLDKKIRNPDILKFVFEISYLLGYLLKKEVIFNYIDDLGFLALALGATGFGGGYFSKEKQLSPELYTDQPGWGQRYAKLYSHSLICDLYAERDLKKIFNLNFLSQIKDDITPHSKDLYDSYINKDNLPPSWETTQNNDTFSQRHKVDLLNRESNIIASLSYDERIKYTRDWLMNADINAVYLGQRLADNPISPNLSHIHVWKNEFEKFLIEKNII